MTTENEKTENEQFFEKLAKAIHEVEEKNRFSGICPQCFGTGREFKKEGDYWGAVARKEGDSFTFSVCTHGNDFSESLPY